jgi:hypothetical protein
VWRGVSPLAPPVVEEWNGAKVGFGRPEEFAGFAGAFLKQKKRMKEVGTGGSRLGLCMIAFITDGSRQQRDQFLFGHVFQCLQKGLPYSVSVFEVTL